MAKIQYGVKPDIFEYALPTTIPWLTASRHRALPQTPRNETVTWSSKSDGIGDLRIGQGPAKRTADGLPQFVLFRQSGSADRAVPHPGFASMQLNSCALTHLRQG